MPPEGDAETIGVVDSGVTSAHPLIINALVGAFGVPPNLGNDDQRGHGTPVSGIAVYGDVAQRLATGTLDAQFRIASAKVLNDAGNFDDVLMLPQQMDDAIRQLHEVYGCRVINLSLGDHRSPVRAKRSAWAAILDQLARELDLVIVVAAGNSDYSLVSGLGDGVAGAYPSFLFDEDNRILEPASAVECSNGWIDCSFQWSSQ